MTADAAWQCHSDHEVGTLEPGKLADVVVLAEDPRSVDPRSLADVEVLETWMVHRMPASEHDAVRSSSAALSGPKMSSRIAWPQ